MVERIESFFFSFFNIYLFIWLCQVLAAACGIFDLHWGFSCGMWDIVPWPGIEHAPTLTPTLGVQSLSHWTTRQVPRGWRLLNKPELYQEFSHLSLGPQDTWLSLWAAQSSPENKSPKPFNITPVLPGSVISLAFRSIRSQTNASGVNRARLK